LKNDLDLRYGDLAEPANALSAVKGNEIIVNLAARVGGIEYNIKHPGSIFTDNLKVFSNVLEAARKADVERFLTVSSACVYPRHCKIPTPEEEGFVGTPEPTNEGYGWAKRMEEFLSMSYAKEYGMKIAIARPYNAYGPRDNFDPKSSHVIPSLIKRILDRENPLVVWGTGNQSRSFLYVEDFAEGILLTCEKYVVADPLNIGADDETTIKDLVNLIIDITRIKTNLVFDKTKPEGQPRRKCDATKAKKILGWEAKTPLKEGLRKTIEWYRGTYEKT
jgi:GDP-L-fucose synthase